MPIFCLTGVSLARLGRTLSDVLAVLLTEVRVCREVSGFIVSQAEQIMPMHQANLQVACFLVLNGPAVQCVAHKLAVCRKVKASSKSMSDVDVILLSCYHLFCAELRRGTTGQPHL